MNSRRNGFQRFLLLNIASCFLIASMSQGSAADEEPIAYIGHGAFFSRDGEQIKLTQDFIEGAQAYYRSRLLSSIPADKVSGFEEVEKELSQSLTTSRQNRLLLQNRFIGSMVASSNDPEAGRIASFLNALESAMRQQIPEDAETDTPPRVFVPDVQIRKLLEKQSLMTDKLKPFANTLNTGQQYIDECRNNGVPIPPPIGKLDPAGTAGWKSLGFIPESAQFIVGTPAELRVFISSSPVGMCFALPRYSDESRQQVTLDGVICLGQISSKVCFWDNQMPVTDPQGTTIGKAFDFKAGEQIPIGVPDLNVDPQGRYQAGGFDLNNGEGGICTSCHAGENPYIIHPKVDLGGGVLMGQLSKPPLNLPTFGATRYDPFVPPSWPQNAGSQATNLVPANCSVCHDQDGPGGRFPELSASLQDYCGFVLRLAVKKTMPPNAPGSLENDPEVLKFLALCLPPTNITPVNAKP